MTRPSAPGPVVPALDGLVLTAAGVEAFDCPFCGDVRDLVVPDCGDEIGGDGVGGDEVGGDHDECPDRACAECGFALVLGPPRPVSASARSTASLRRAG